MKIQNFNFVSHAFTLFGRTNLPCEASSEPWWFFPSLNKPGLEITHGLVLCIPSRHRGLVMVLPRATDHPLPPRTHSPADDQLEAYVRKWAELDSCTNMKIASFTCLNFTSAKSSLRALKTTWFVGTQYYPLKGWIMSNNHKQKEQK